jgi:IS5 family transposase
VKERFRGLQKNTSHLLTLRAPSNLWMARKPLMAMTGAVRLKVA